LRCCGLVVLLFGCLSAHASNLEESLRKTTASSLRDSCDIELLESKLEVARALDSRADDLVKWLEEHPQGDPDFTLVKLGPIYLKERNVPLEPEYKWTEIWKDWANVIARYRAIQTQPVDQRWITLAEDVQWLVSNDYRRLVDERNFGLDEQSPDYLQEASAAVDSCLANPQCSRPEWSPRTAEFLAENRIYSDILGSEQSRKAIEILKRRIQIDLKTRYNFWRMSNISRVDANTWSVPMYTHEFAENRDEIAQRIMRMWKSATEQVIIRWVDDVAPENFRFIADLSVGARPGTSYPNHTVTLTNEMFATTIAHEFGHVLGFRDRYFEIWDAPRCGYRSRANGADIMSRSRSGTVVQYHWDTLRREYQ